MLVNKLLKRIFAVILALGLIVPAYALAPGTMKALEAFKRYEPDFSNYLRKIQEVGRKLDTEKVSLTSERGLQLKGDAAEYFEFIQRRYDLMSDLYKSVMSGSPDDRAALMEGFSRIDDLYREVREYYTARFEEGREPTKPASQLKSEKSAVPAGKAPEVIPTVQPPVEGTTTAPATAPVPEKTVGEKKDDARKTETSGTAEKAEKAHLTGSLNLEAREKKEKYTNPPTSTLPNNLQQTKLSLRYDFDEKNKGLLEDKYLHRKRNELVVENYLTLSLLHTHSPNSAVSFKDSLHHVFYPDNTIKNYRDNLAELMWNKKENKWERFYNVGYETRKYPNYTQSDFHQFNYKGETTYFIPNGTLFGSSVYNVRGYGNSSNLDYTNTTLDFQYNQSFSGNKSEVSVADTYDLRRYGNEAVNLFRTNYWDNYFTFSYNIPVSKTFTWLFEDEYQQRTYPSDDPRGYAQVKLKTTGKITIDKNSRARVGYTYINNDENTKAKAHKNHIFNGQYEKKYSEKFKIKAENTYHNRITLIGNIMDFNENDATFQAIWKLPSKIELNWKSEFLTRAYATLYYSDYQYWMSGLHASYVKPKKYDWQLSQDFRGFSYKNGNNTATGWISQAQPVSEFKYHLILRDDLKLKLTACREKTYYKTFDSIAQELLWDFTRPMTVTEFTGGLEYDF